MKKYLEKIKTKYTQMPVQAKAGVWLVICNILVKGINFITIPIFTRLMPAAEYGDLTVYLSSTEIILILSGWDISYGAYQKGLYKYDDTVFFTKTVQLFCTASTAAVVLVLAGLYPLTGKWLSVPAGLYPVMFLYLLTQPSYRNWMALKQKNYEYKKVTGITLFYTIAVTVFSLIAVVFTGRRADIKYTAQMVMSFAVFVFFYIRNMNIFPLFQDLPALCEEMKYIVRFQFPCLIHSLSLLILGQADRIMIRRYAGSTQAALYGVAYSFAFLLSVIQSALDQALIPWRYELLGKKKYSQVNVISCTLLTMIAGMTAVFILIAPELMKLFFSAEYYEAIGLIPPIAASVYFIFLYSMFVGVEGYFENTKMLMYIAVMCSMLNIGLNYIGIRIFGYKVCAYTTLVSYIMFCAGHYLAMNRMCRKYIQRKVFHEKYILMISAAMLLFTVGIGFVYQMAFIRYAFFAFLVLTGITQRKRIQKTIMMIRNKEE